MKWPPFFELLSELEYQQMVAQEKENAEITKGYLTLIQGKDKGVFLVHDLINLHEHLMLFRDSSLVETLQKIGLTNDELHWFVSIEKIEEVFNQIESYNIHIDKFSALCFIKTHLNFKFRDRILRWGNQIIHRDQVLMNTVSKMFHDLKNRQNYGIGKVRSSRDVMFTSINEIVQPIFKECDNLNMDILIKLSKGKTESIFLKRIIRDCFDYDPKDMSRTDFLSNIYELFRLIMPDKILENEDEFFKKGDIQEINFRIYSAKKLEKLILKKKDSTIF